MTKHKYSSWTPTRSPPSVWWRTAELTQLGIDNVYNFLPVTFAKIPTDEPDTDNAGLYTSY